ncbi:MAG: hypothetical protein REI94_20335 [Moraxellaceae bacterium]|nr:hypothetical protein [Moraxellaceae bacterium]
MRTFKKEQLKGLQLDQLQNPSRDALPQLLQERLRAYAQANAALRPPVKFEVASETWLLVYEDLNATDTPYQLRYTTSIVARPAAESGKSLPDVSLRCAPAPAAMPLTKWEADEYAQVRQTADTYVSACVEQVTTHFPELFRPASVENS